MNMAKVIAQRRKKMDMTRGELAEQLNVSERMITLWEEDKRYPDTQLIPLLAKTLDLRIGELFEEGQGEDAVASNEKLDAGQIWRYQKRMLMGMLSCVVSAVMAVGMRMPFFQSDGMNYIIIPMLLFVFLAVGVLLIAVGEFRFRSFYHTVYRFNVYYDAYLKADVRWFGLAVLLVSLLVSVIVPLGIGAVIRGAGLGIVVLVYLFDSLSFFAYAQLKKKYREKQIVFSKNYLLAELGAGLLGWSIFLLYLVLRWENLYIPPWGVALFSVPFLGMQLIGYVELLRETR